MGVAIIIPDVNFASANLGKVTLTEDVPVRALSIIAPDSISGTSYQLGVSFYPINTNQRNVIWSIESGSEYAYINSSGVLDIKQEADNSQITVNAKSISNPSVFSTVKITVTYQGADNKHHMDFGFRHNDDVLSFYRELTGDASLGIGSVTNNRAYPYTNFPIPAGSTLYFDNDSYKTKYSFVFDYEDYYTNISIPGADNKWASDYMSSEITLTKEVRALQVKKNDNTDFSAEELNELKNHLIYV